MSEAYKIAVSLVMASNAPAFLSALSSKILHVHTQVKDLEGGLNRLSRIKLAIGGGLAIAGGAAMLTALGKVIDKGAEYQRMQNNMRLAGMNEAEVAKATARAWEMTAKYRSLGVVRIGDMINEVRSVYGDTATAAASIEPALKAATVLQSTLKGKGQEGIVGQVFDMFKSADLRNITDDPKLTEKFFDNMTKVVTATGGKVTPKDFLQMIKYSKSAGQTWSDEFITRIAASMMQEGSPSTVGTALASMDQSVVGGKTTMQSNAMYARLGLIKKGAAVFGNKGNIKDIEAGGIVGGDLFRENPYEWVQKVLKPRIIADLMKKNGGKLINEDQLMSGAIPILSGLYGNRNAEWIANTMFKERPIERDRALISGAQGLEGADLLLKKDWHTAVQSFTTQWDNLMTALGAPAVGTATDMLNKLTSVVAELAQAAKGADPATIQNIAKGIAIAGVALTGGGAVALLAALGPAGWLAAGVIAVGAAFVAFKPQMDQWIRDVTGLGPQLDAADKKFNEAALGFGAWLKSLKPGLDAADKTFNEAALAFGKWMKGLPAIIAELPGTLKNIATALGNEIKTWPDAISAEIKTWPGRVGDAIAGMGAAIVQKLKDMFNSLNPFSKASFEGGAGSGSGGSLIQNASFSTGGANDNFGGGSIARGLRRGGGLGGSGGSGAITTALPASPGLRGEVQAYLRAAAEARGIDPNVAERVMRQESGFNPYARNINSRERSYGVFQLNTMGGLGNVAQRHGIDPTDPSQWKRHIDFGLDVVRRDGWRQWYGARDVGIGRWQGIGRRPITHSGAPTAPTAGPPPRSGGKTEVLQVNLDGRKMAEVVLKRAAAASRFPRHVGGMDTHGSYRSPGTTLTDAA